VPANRTVAVPSQALRLILLAVGLALWRNASERYTLDWPWSFYECDPVREVLEKLDPRSAGNIDSWIVPQREAQSLLERTAGALGRIIALAPRAISVHPSVSSGEVWLRFRGLAIAKWDMIAFSSEPMSNAKS